MRYPVLNMYLKNLYNNALLMRKFCQSHGIEPVAVIKGFNAIGEAIDTVVDAGFSCLASSRLPHLQKVRERGHKVKTLALRIPMLSEIDMLVQCADISLNSSLATIAAINEEAGKAQKVHNVILMRDLGDLREGIYDRDEFIDTACEIEATFKNIHLLGIGTNVFCYGTVRPSSKNMTELVNNAREIEKRIGRKLEVVSGGSSISIPLILRGGMPEGINHIRIGSILMYHTLSLHEDELPELRDVFSISAEIIEINEKPTVPIGELAYDCFGNSKHFEDLGVRRRVLLALGAFDIGDAMKLMPFDKGAKVLGASSDHLIVDIHDSKEDYVLGSVMTFRMPYQSILFSTSSSIIARLIHDD